MRDEADVIDMAERVDLDDVRVVQLGHRPRLGLEPLQIRRLGEEVGAEDLEGHRPVQAELPRQVDIPHPPASQQPLHPEIAQGDPAQVA